MNAANSDDVRFAQMGWVPRSNYAGRLVSGVGPGFINQATTLAKGDDVMGGFYTLYGSVTILSVAGNIRLTSRADPTNIYWDFNAGYNSLLKHMRERPAGVSTNPSVVRRGVEVWADCDYYTFGTTRSHELLTETESGTTYLGFLTSPLGVTMRVARQFNLTVYSRPVGHAFSLGLTGEFRLFFRAPSPIWAHSSASVIPSGNLTVTYRTPGKPVKEVVLAASDIYA